jgi:peptide/nickel transport system substrate-binding protein
VKYDNRIDYFEANENYFKGDPSPRNVQFKETIDSEIIAGIAVGYG